MTLTLTLTRTWRQQRCTPMTPSFVPRVDTRVWLIQSKFEANRTNMLKYIQGLKRLKLGLCVQVPEREPH